jgi:hypothetical protein
MIEWVSTLRTRKPMSGGGEGGSETVFAIESEGGPWMKSAFPAPTGRNAKAQSNALGIKS